MAFSDLTQQKRNELANALARAEALVRANVNRIPDNYPADTTAALEAAKVELDAALA